MFNGDFIKKLFIVLAYLTYLGTTIAKQQLKIDLGNYEFIFVAIIGICLKLSASITQIETIINQIDITKINDITERLADISINLSQQNTHRSIGVLDDNTPNEPYEASETETHRDVNINKDYVLRICKN
jgi:hypothetical protein